MELTYLLLFVLSVAALLGWGLSSSDRVYQYPTVAGLAFASFLTPQAIGISRSKSLPDGVLGGALLIATSCGLAVLAGHALGRRRGVTAVPLYNPNWLMVGAIFLTIMGGYFHLQIALLPPEAKEGQWTGIAVAYNFFAQALSYGFALAVLLALKHRTPVPVITAVVGALLVASRIFIGARRGTTFEFIAILGLSVWFVHRKALPRPILVLAGILATLFLFSTGEYRYIVSNEGDDDWKLSQIPFVENFRRILSEGGVEFYSGALEIEATRRRGDYDLGLFHWDRFVFNYVPAQVVGEELKKSLMLNMKSAAEEEFNYTTPIGATVTGITDSFRSFWYFGFVKFFAIAFAMRRLYDNALAGSMWSQACYMMMMAPGVHCITHSTHWFLNPWPHMAVFLLPILAISRIRVRIRNSAQTKSASHAPRRLSRYASSEK